MHIIPMYLRLTTFTKTLPGLNVIDFTYIFLLFLFRSGVPPMTLLTAGALTDPQLPATASNVCTTDAWLGLGESAGWLPPNKNPGYASDSDSEHILSMTKLAFDVMYESQKTQLRVASLCVVQAMCSLHLEK